MTHSTDPELAAALDEDAAKLEAMGADPGPEVEDYDDEYDDYDPDAGQIGCWRCESGWRHGCCDDLCYGSTEPVDCDNARPCHLCNPRGEVLF